MKTRFCKSIVCMALILLLGLSLTGCDALDYRNAIDRYNSGDFDAAAESFALLGDYEDSRDLAQQSRYWAALSCMEQGQYQEAVNRFRKLGDYQDSQQRMERSQYLLAVQAMEAGDFADAIARFTELDGYEDSSERITECAYQLAIAAFRAEDYEAAREQFSQLEDYRSTGDYLRQIGWQRFFDWVVSSGEANGTACTLQADKAGQVIVLTADTAEPKQISFRIEATKDMGYVFTDSLTLTLLRDDPYAAFTGISTFTMTLNTDSIGTTQQSTGRVDVRSCTADTVLSVETYEKTGTDNKGNAIASQDPGDNTMYNAMAENLQTLLKQIPSILAEKNAEVSLADLGFPQ